MGLAAGLQPSGWSVGTVCDTRSYTIHGDTFRPPYGNLDSDYGTFGPEQPGSYNITGADEYLPMFLGECAGGDLNLVYPGMCAHRPAADTNAVPVCVSAVQHAWLCKPENAVTHQL